MGVLIDLIYLLLVVVSAPRLLRKRRTGWRERFGRVQPLPRKVCPRLLLHAVSVGEVNLLHGLVDRLTDPSARSRLSADRRLHESTKGSPREPVTAEGTRSTEVVVSVTTDTGIARARELYAHKPGVTVVHSPLDASWAVRRFFNAVAPDAVALVELELWPNFARVCRKRGIPLAIINGRVSERSAPRYRLLRPVFGRFFRSLAFCAVQDETYRERFVAIGVPPDRCIVAGTMKWDAADGYAANHSDGAKPESDCETAAPPVNLTGEKPVPPVSSGAEALAADLGIDGTRLLIVAGSTAPDEHALLHAATPAGVQLLCAPRRPEWFEQAALDLPGCVRRSAMPRGAKKTVSVGPDTSCARADSADVNRFLLDTIGELSMAYSLADIVVIGRSFGELYGSDPMAPAALAKPVVIGPSVTDFAQTVETMKQAGAIIQTTREHLADVLADLAANPDRRRALSERAVACVRENQGATERHARLLLELLFSARPESSHAGA